jgi:hypothetical protein
MAVYYDFAGQKIIKPGAYTKRSFPTEQGLGNLSGRVIIMGEAAKGGIPFDAFTDIEDVINTVDGQAQALNVFGGGSLYYASEFFLTPSKDDRFNAPAKADCIVVNQMTQASGALLNGVTDIIDVKFNKFGTDGNQAAIKVSAGSVTGKLLQLSYKGNEVLNKDNVDLPMMAVQYTGLSDSALLSISATALTTVCSGATGDNLDITLADFESLGSLVNFINAKTAYTCTLTGKSDEKANVFDVVTSQDIVTASYSAKGIVEALIRAITGTEVFTATLHTGSTRLVPDNLSVFTFLTGGTVSAATTQNWTDALEKLEKYDVNCLVIASGSATIKALVNAHVTKMNGMTVKKYRQWISGASTVENTKALRIAEMKSINSAYAEYCVSPFKRYDYVNKEVPTTDFEAFYLGAMVAGLRYANNVGMDVVFKYLNVLSTPEISEEDQNDYAEAGATLIQKTNNVFNGSQNFEILINNTTYQGSQVTRTNPAVVYEINVLTKFYEEYVIEQLRGLDGVANSVIIASIQNKITTYLFPVLFRDSYRWITDYTDPDTGAVQPAFSNVVFRQEGEQFITEAVFTMSVTPRFAFNFFTFITPGQYI